MFKTCLCFPCVIGLYGCKFFRSIDGFIMEDTIEFKGKFERRDVDVEFAVDGVFAVEVKLKGRVKLG